MLSRQRVTVTALVIIINASEFDGGDDAEGDESGNGTGADGDNDGMNAGNSETENNSGSANIGNGGTDTGNNGGWCKRGDNSTHANNGNTGAGVVPGRFLLTRSYCLCNCRCGVCIGEEKEFKIIVRIHKQNIIKKSFS